MGKGDGQPRLGSRSMSFTMSDKLALGGAFDTRIPRSPKYEEEGVHWCPFCEQKVEAYSSRIGGGDKRYTYWEHTDRNGVTCAGSKEKVDFLVPGSHVGILVAVTFVTHLLLRPEGWDNAYFFTAEAALVSFFVYRRRQYATAPQAVVHRNFDVNDA